jgi:hypothetical protein
MSTAVTELGASPPSPTSLSVHAWRRSLHRLSESQDCEAVMRLKPDGADPDVWDVWMRAVRDMDTWAELPPVTILCQRFIDQGEGMCLACIDPGDDGAVHMCPPYHGEPSVALRTLPRATGESGCTACAAPHIDHTPHSCPNFHRMCMSCRMDTSQNQEACSCPGMMRARITQTKAI